MDLTERERLRQRLNFPQPINDPPPPRTPFAVGPECEPPVIEQTAPVEAPVEASAAEPVEVAALSRLTEIIERLDDRVEGNRLELERINERLDGLEAALRETTSEGEHLVGIEAVRRTVAASHRVLTGQLSRMIGDVEARLQRQVQSAELR